jgi:hypothetical protein
MKFKVLLVLVSATCISLFGCVSANPAAQHVRVTNNPEVVKGCEFLGNVKAMSGWAGGAGSGMAAGWPRTTSRKR